MVHITHIVPSYPKWQGLKVPLIFACMYLQFSVYLFHWLCIYTVTLYKSILIQDKCTGLKDQA